jgi:hypothetical protein
LLKNRRTLSGFSHQGKERRVVTAYAATLGGGVAATTANALLSRALVNPRTARWLAQTAKMPISALPNAVNQLDKMGQANNDPDATDLAAHLQQTRPGT